MAIKDWKKVQGKNKWRKGRNEVEVINIRNGWTVFADYEYRFKTKSKALKYARAYMRKN